MKQINKTQVNSDFDLEGLKSDFPTAKELERFVYDQTQVVLNLKGRSNDVKYAVALQVLNGEDIDPKFLGADNPYIERADLVPEEPIKPAPDRSSNLPDLKQMSTSFYSGMIPHPDPAKRSEGKKVDCVFRKYRNGVLSYEVLGPLEPRPEGMKLDKFGRERPEIIRWVDPRTGEQMMRDKDGSYSEVGNRLRGMLQKQGLWHWVDRDTLVADRGLINDVWGNGE